MKIDPWNGCVENNPWNRPRCWLKLLCEKNWNRCVWKSTHEMAVWKQSMKLTLVLIKIAVWKELKSLCETEPVHDVFWNRCVKKNCNRCVLFDLEKRSRNLYGCHVLRSLQGSVLQSLCIFYWGKWSRNSLWLPGIKSFTALCITVAVFLFFLWLRKNDTRIVTAAAAVYLGKQKRFCVYSIHRLLVWFECD